MTPSQEHTRQSAPAPRQFGPNDWQFSLARSQQLDWVTGADVFTSDNFSSKGEGYQTVKNGMFNPLTGQEPVFGQINEFLNPLEQEQTGGQGRAYANQKVTRVQDNMSAAPFQRFPAYQYPVGRYYNHFVGSRVK